MTLRFGRKLDKTSSCKRFATGCSRRAGS